MRAEHRKLSRIFVIVLLGGTVIILWGAGAAIAQDAEPAAQNPAALPDLPGTSVSIPWSELKTLVKGAQPPVVKKPPVDMVFAPATYTVKIHDGVADIEATTGVDVLVDDWVLIPLGSGTGLTGATIDGKATSIVKEGGQVFAVTQGKGNRSVKLAAQVKVHSEGGRQWSEVSLLPSPIVSLAAEIPGGGLAIEVSGATSTKVEVKNEVSRVAARLTGGTTARLTWKKTLPVGDARTYAETSQQVHIGDGLARVRARTQLEIVHGAQDKIQLAIHPQAVVLSAAGKQISGWETKVANDTQIVTLTAAMPLAGKHQVEIVYEFELDDQGDSLPLSGVSVLGAKRDRGVVAVASSGAYDIQPTGANVQRISTSQLPSDLRSNETVLAYRYARTPVKISLALKRPQAQAAEIRVSTATLVSVSDGRLRSRAHVTYNVRHAPVDSFRVALPDGVTVQSTLGKAIRATSVVAEAEKRFLVVDLKDIVQGEYALEITYESRFKPDDKTPQVAVLGHPDAVEDHGFLGVEVRASYDVAATINGGERVDVTELPQRLWNSARSPVLLGYRYVRQPVTLALSLKRHEDLDVLVAMSDVCEVATTVTPDGKGVTKLMYVVRNNQKPFMTLRLPKEAQVWSTFVNDRPVTPARNAAGHVLIPLQKSEEVDDENEDGYRARRDKRRNERIEQGQRPSRRKTLRERGEEPPSDLKPYDVEIVFVQPKLELKEGGELRLALPQSDIPTGHLAWAVFVPKSIRIVDSSGTLKEVGAFTLPFRHFGDVTAARNDRVSMEKMAKQA
ncbi:MAG TPA: hypothetical protein VMX74_03600, partial [Pirellulales bacterium]|nr:hypothetical protein [Pirellulales bacterium]